MLKTKIERLHEAEIAYHQLLTGTAAVSIEDAQSGTKVQYTRANKHTLENYIEALKIELGRATPRRRRPARVRF